MDRCQSNKTNLKLPVQLIAFLLSNQKLLVGSAEFALKSFDILTELFSCPAYHVQKSIIDLYQKSQ